MRILLLGEYSGLFNCLKDGLIELGHDVTLISDGDGYKNYSSDYSWRVNYPGKIGSYASVIKAVTLFDKFRGYDVVHVISPFVICSRPFWGPLFFQYLKNNNASVFLSGAGMTAQVYNYWLSRPDDKYYNYVYEYINDAGGNKNKVPFSSQERAESERQIMSLINGYIPIMHEYSAPFSNYSNLLETIPIPINLSKYKYSPNVIQGKITFFHGITKSCKGGHFIIDAFERLKIKHHAEANFLVNGGIPFNEYVKFLLSVNVVLDDANAYSLGMNSLFSMAQGRVVMGGAECIGNKELKYTQCPAINLVPNSGYISEQIEELINNKNDIEELGFNSRRFVECHHNHILIAEKYLKTWQENV